MTSAQSWRPSCRSVVAVLVVGACAYARARVRARVCGVRACDVHAKGLLVLS